MYEKKNLLLFAFLIASASSLASCGLSIPKITGIEGSLSLDYGGEVVECPMEYRDSKPVYYVTTLNKFYFRVSPIHTGSRSLHFEGDCVTFLDAYSNIINGNCYTSYGTFSHQNSLDDDLGSTYLATFSRSGIYEINFSVGKFTSSLKVICDDYSDKYEKYQYELSSFFSWTKAIKEEDVDQISYECGAIGVAPGSLKSITYSSDKKDISGFFNLFNSKLMIVDSYAYAVSGGSYGQYSYYSNGEIHSLRFDNGFIYLEEANVKYLYCKLISIPGSLSLSNPSRTAYKFITYGSSNECEVKNVSDDSVFKTIDYLNDIEFEEYESSEILSDPKYYIDDWNKLSDKLSIYSKDIFGYQNKTYKITNEFVFDFFE